MIDFLKSIPWQRWFGVAICLVVLIAGVWQAWSTPVDGWALDGMPEAGAVTIWERLLSSAIWIVSAGGVGAAILLLGRKK